MSWTDKTHPYKQEGEGGGVNNISVALGNILLLGSVVWFLSFLFINDMSNSQVADTTPSDEQGFAYIMTPDPDALGDGGINFRGTTNDSRPSATEEANTIFVTQPTPISLDDVSEQDVEPLYPPDFMRDLIDYVEVLDDSFVVYYSYYNPALLGVNCLTVENGKCVSRLGTGEEWSDFIDQNVVAVPPRWFSEGIISMNDTIVIIHPLSVAGHYTVKDNCTGCDKYFWSQYDKFDRIDLLTSRQELAWSTPLTIAILRGGSVTGVP